LLEVFFSLFFFFHLRLKFSFKKWSRIRPLCLCILTLLALQLSYFLQVNQSYCFLMTYRWTRCLSKNHLHARNWILYTRSSFHAYSRGFTQSNKLIMIWQINKPCQPCEALNSFKTSTLRGSERKRQPYEALNALSTLRGYEQLSIVGTKGVSQVNYWVLTITRY